jgi:HK97 gp10 family phage protein
MARQSFKFELTGMKELMSALEQLPTVAMQKGAIRNALKDAGQPVVSDAKTNVPVDSGHLRDSIKVSQSLKKTQRKGRYDRSSVTVYVGSSSPLAHLIEFGTTQRVLKEPRIVTIGGRTVQITHTGQISPRPFLRQAWDAKKNEVLKRLGDALWRQIAKSARRLAKKAARGTLTRRQIEGLNK